MEDTVARVGAMRALALLLVVAVLCAGQVRRLVPRDDSSKDASLAAFTAKLKETVAREDAAGLEAVLSPVIKTGFDGNGGIAEFRSKWKLDRPHSEVWPLLARMLALGGTLKDGNYSVPYVIDRFPEDLDAFDHAAITGRGVWLRSGASTSSRGIRKLDYEIVRVQSMEDDWWPVETLDGKRGFVSAKYVQSPVGWRAYFSKEQGSWKMTALVAGD